jgi:hypothetical protein
MSHKFSNLFASRVFAEHPLASWPLDENVYFLSALEENQKSIENWEQFNIASPLEEQEVFGIPLIDEALFSFIPASSSPAYMEFVGASIDESTKLDSTKPTVCISSFVYAEQSIITTFEIGFKYKNNEDLEYTYDIKEFSNTPGVWQKIIHTIELPNVDDLKPYLKIYYVDSTITDEYLVYVNATSVGQWSELYHNDSTGIIPEELDDANLNSLLPDSSPLGIKVIEADAYGLLENKSGYYIVDNNKLLVTNSSLPMIFGSSNVTNIESPIISGMPSLVLPGQGFLNESGRHKESTVEFWLRVYTRSRSAKKIFGPLASSDGLYLEEEFLTFRVGKFTKSYFVGKWYRPMLIDIRYNEEIVSMLINGDLAFSFNIDQASLIFPNASKDWLGFFGHVQVYPFDIDCVSIYPYIVSEQIAKKRFVFGQGVASAESIVSNLGGESIYVDFPFAKYTSTMNYPDMSGWNSGFFNNLDATSKFLSFPNYRLPEINYVGPDLEIFLLTLKVRTWIKTSQKVWNFWKEGTWDRLRTERASDVLEDNFFIQDGERPFITLRPNESYENIFGSIYFDSTNPIDSPVKSIFGLFRAPEVLPTDPEIIMQFNSKTTPNLFKVTLSDEGLQYFYNDTLLATKSVSASADFIAGIELDKLNIEYQGTLNNFFSSLQNISLSIAGYGLNTFSGRIYSTTFNNKFFTDKDLLSYVSDEGIFGFGEEYSAEYAEEFEDIFDYLGNYTYHPLLLEDALIVDIGCIGYWEDSLPFTYFGKFVEGKNQNSFYDLDLIQFNIENPGPVVCSGNLTQCGQRDLRINSFVTIQDFTQVGKKPYSEYTDREVIGSNRVLDIDKYNFEDIQTKRFEIVDGTIIYPPKDLVDFNDYYLTTHIEMRNQGILSRSVQLRSMSYASLAYDETDFYPINTRTGNKIFPFSRYESAYAPKDKNPFVINKQSNPYMYLTADSGINVLPYETQAVRGISIPINQQKNSNYILGGIQIWMFYNKDFTFNNISQVAKIKTNTKELDFYVIPEKDGKRATIKTYDSITGIEELNIIYYQNGEVVTNPIIYPQLWSSLVASFGDGVFLNSQIGQLELYEGFTYNNIAMYKKESIVFGSDLVFRTWNDILSTVIDIPGPSDPTINLSWDFWINFDWSQLESETQLNTFSLDGQEVYQSFFGLSKVVSSDNSKVLVNSDSFKIVTDVIWEAFEGRPV